VVDIFNMDTFNVIQINPSLLRANLLNEDDINNYINYYSQQTPTIWCVGTKLNKVVKP